jgi:hypothetical protein
MKLALYGILVLGLAAAWPFSANAGQFNDADANMNGVKLELASVDPRATPDFLPSTSVPPFSHLCSCGDKGLAPMQCHMVINANGMDIMGQEDSDLRQCNTQPENKSG